MSVFLHLWGAFTRVIRGIGQVFSYFLSFLAGLKVLCCIRYFFAGFYVFISFMPSIVLAEAEKTPPAKPHFIEQMMPFIFIFILFYFLLIRPAQKRQKTHQNLVNQLKKGDSVITSSGILGIIHGLTDSFVTLEVADNVRIRVLRSQISSLVEKDKPDTRSKKT